MFYNFHSLHPVGGGTFMYTIMVFNIHPVVGGTPAFYVYVDGFITYAL